MLKCSTSLWSADLANLAAEVRRVEPYSERFHLDVADGHYVPTLLFFPDLVRALRPHTARPFEVHLMTTDPLAWVEPFLDAGADGFLFCFDTLDDPARAIDIVRSRGKFVGLSLSLGDDLSALEPYWDVLDQVTILGTALGIKGAAMDESVPAKVRRARAIVDSRRLSTEIQVDGGIRAHTVPTLASAGADWVVPGSLFFGSDPGEVRRWLDGLPGLMS